MIEKTTRRPATAAMFAAAQSATAGNSRRAHVPKTIKTGTRRRWLRAVVSSLFALATLFLGFAGPAQADGAQSLQIPLDGVFLNSPVDFGGLTLSGTAHVVVAVGPRLAADGTKTVSIHTDLQNVVASSATTTCRLTGADSSERTAISGKFLQEYKASEPCASAGRPVLRFTAIFDSEGNLVSVSVTAATLLP